MKFQEMKPLLRRCRNGWSCLGLGVEGNGSTPRGAYMDWLSEACLPPYI